MLLSDCVRQARRLVYCWQLHTTHQLLTLELVFWLVGSVTVLGQRTMQLGLSALIMQFFAASPDRLSLVARLSYLRDLLDFLGFH